MKLQKVFQVIDTRTDEPTRPRPFHRRSDVVQHLKCSFTNDDLPHLAVVEYRLVKKLTQNSGDFVAKRDPLENPTITIRERGA